MDKGDQYRDASTEPYAGQAVRWPSAGRHILAHHDAETIVVYQAYRPSIGNHAVASGALGGDFSYARMSWIKPNFLWMMYRSGWGTKTDQEITLGLRLRREFFDGLLAQAVASSFERARYATHGEWRSALASSAVRLQRDPDYDPAGNPVARRAIQLGLRGPHARSLRQARAARGDRHERICCGPEEAAGIGGIAWAHDTGRARLHPGRSGDCATDRAGLSRLPSMVGQRCR